MIELKDILARTDEWLKYGEAKNGALLALCGAFTFGLLQNPCKLMGVHWLIDAAFILMLILLVVSMVICLSSFLPKLTPPWVNFNHSPNDINILYFGDICCLTPQTFLSTYYDKVDKKESFSKEDSQYAKQIVVNSKIAYIKHTQFKIAAWLTMCALITPVGALLLKFIGNKF
ncbi:TPA: hypothetical protein KLD78_001525 [Legionella pneumophila]|nr:hypothetical protein [Legionella pneumophila]HAT7919951.1 hypothetical protein [Legionella pneumophila]HAT7924304.1 hypothetical protein [Legionella pneumophila]HAT7934241.1 hypothetical protein [Legionella pneumophila]HAT8808764.1 hypothetical protein [Legionella pneumophila]